MELLPLATEQISALIGCYGQQLQFPAFSAVMMNQHCFLNESYRVSDRGGGGEFVLLTVLENYK